MKHFVVIAIYLFNIAQVAADPPHATATQKAEAAQKSSDYPAGVQGNAVLKEAWDTANPDLRNKIRDRVSKKQSLTDGGFLNDVKAHTKRVKEAVAAAAAKKAEEDAAKKAAAAKQTQSASASATPIVDDAPGVPGLEGEVTAEPYQPPKPQSRSKADTRPPSDKYDSHDDKYSDHTQGGDCQNCFPSPEPAPPIPEREVRVIRETRDAIEPSGPGFFGSLFNGNPAGYLLSALGGGVLGYMIAKNKYDQGNAGGWYPGYPGYPPNNPGWPAPTPYPWMRQPQWGLPSAYPAPVPGGPGMGVGFGGVGALGGWGAPGGSYIGGVPGMGMGYGGVAGFGGMMGYNPSAPIALPYPGPAPMQSPLGANYTLPSMGGISYPVIGGYR